MKKLLLFCACSLAMVGFASSAVKAASMDVTYAIGGSGFLGGIIPIGPPGTLAGSMTVTYTATGGVLSGTSGAVLHGPAVLAGLSFGGPISFTLFGDLFTGSLIGGAGPAGPGTLTSGFGDLLLPISGLVTGGIHCTGATCTGLGITASLPVPLSIPFAGLLAAPLVGSISGTVMPSFGIAPLSFGTFGGFVITAMLSATEVSRHYVPEPSTLPLMALGLAGLVMAGRKLRI